MCVCVIPWQNHDPGDPSIPTQNHRKANVHQCPPAPVSPSESPSRWVSPANVKVSGHRAGFAHRWRGSHGSNATRCKGRRLEHRWIGIDASQNEKSQDNDASWLSVFARNVLRNARALVFSDIFRPFEAVWVTNGTCCWAIKPVEMVDMNCSSNVEGIHPDAINPSSGTARPIFSCAATACNCCLNDWTQLSKPWPLMLRCYATRPSKTASHSWSRTRGPIQQGCSRLLPRSREIWHCQGHILHNFMIFHY